jgi:hypothetical protein
LGWLPSTWFPSLSKIQQTKKEIPRDKKKTIVKETQNAYDVEAVQGCRAAAQAEAAVSS